MGYESELVNKSDVRKGQNKAQQQEGADEFYIIGLIDRVFFIWSLLFCYAAINIFDRGQQDDLYTRYQ